MTIVCLIFLGTDCIDTLRHFFRFRYLSPKNLGVHRAEYKTMSGKNTTSHVKFAMSTWYWYSLTSTSTHSYSASDTPLIDRLVMRAFMSGLSSYRSIHKRVRDRKPSLRGRVQGQFVDLEQSSLRNYNVLETDSYLRFVRLKSPQRLWLYTRSMCMWCLFWTNSECSFETLGLMRGVSLPLPVSIYYWLLSGVCNTEKSENRERGFIYTCTVLQYDAVCIAVWYSVLQRVAVRCREKGFIHWKTEKEAVVTVYIIKQTYYDWD